MYKSKLISGTDNNNVNNVKLVVSLKYVSNFFRSLEMPLVNCKIDLELTWHKDCMISSVKAAAGQVVSFMITNTKLHVPIVTLSTKDNNRVIRNSYRKYFVPRVEITRYNVLIDGRNFYDQPINYSVRKYDEIRKIATGKGDNYATGCLLDHGYFNKNYQLIAVDLSKQRELDVDPRAIQQIEFIGMLKTRLNVFTILEKSKETILEFYKGTAKVM